MKVTAQLYGQLVVSSQLNCTGTYLAEHLDGLTHDNERWPSDVIAAVLLVVAASKTGYFLYHNFRALAALRETFQRFLPLMSLNLGMIARSLDLDFFCLYRIYPHAFSGLRSGTELDISGSWLT